MQSSRTTTSSPCWSMVSVPGVGFSTAGPRVQTVSPAVVTGVCPGKLKKLHTHFSTLVPERCPEPLSLRMPLLLWGDDMKPERTRNDVGTPPDCAPHTNIRVSKVQGSRYGLSSHHSFLSPHDPRDLQIQPREEEVSAGPNVVVVMSAFLSTEFRRFQTYW